MSLLNTESGVTLRPEEVAILRNAADALFFDEEGRSEAADEAKQVLARLTDSERWSDERADRLSTELDGCGALVGV